MARPKRTYRKARGIIRKPTYRKRLTVSKVKAIASKIVKANQESIKIENLLTAYPTNQAYQPLMYVPVDYPLDNAGDEVALNFYSINNANTMASKLLPAQYSPAPLSIMRGNKTKRIALKIRIRVDGAWCTGAFATSSSGPGFTAQGNLPILGSTATSSVQSLPNSCHCWFRISLLRAKKSCSDADLETYLQSATPPGIDLAWNSTKVVVAYDKKFRLDSASRTGFNIRIPLKRATQKQNRLYESLNNGLTTWAWITRAKLYLVISGITLTGAPITDSTNLKWYFLPFFSTNITEWLKDS